MKHLFLLLTFLLFGKISNGQKQQQTLGFQVGGLSREGTLNPFSTASGVFFYYYFNNRWGIGIAGNYRQEIGKTFCYSCIDRTVTPDVPFVKFRSHYLEFPVNIILNLNKNLTASWKTNMLFGATSGFFLKAVLKDSQTDEKIAEIKPHNFSGATLFGNFGVEVKHNFSKDYIIALNPGLRVGAFDYYPQTHFYFWVKFGRILGN